MLKTRNKDCQKEVECKKKDKNKMPHTPTIQSHVRSVSPPASPLPLFAKLGEGAPSETSDERDAEEDDDEIMTAGTAYGSDASHPTLLDLDITMAPALPILALSQPPLNWPQSVALPISRSTAPPPLQAQSSPFQYYHPAPIRPLQRKTNLIPCAPDRSAGAIVGVCRGRARLAAAVSVRRTARLSLGVLGFGRTPMGRRLKGEYIFLGGPVSTGAGCGLLNLADDLLLRIVQILLRPVTVGGSERVVERGYRGAVSIAGVCRRLREIFHRSLVDLELWQSGTIGPAALIHLSFGAGRDLRRIVLRKCARLTAASLASLTSNCPSLKSLDISHIPSVTDSALATILTSLPVLSSLLIRGCTSITDAGLLSLAVHARALDAIDMASLPTITDAGMVIFLHARGAQMVSIVISDCPSLTDLTFAALGRTCTSLSVLCARKLPNISNDGVEALCAGVGNKFEVLDILDCDRVGVARFLASLEDHCPRMSRRFMGGAGRSLRQVVISSLPGYIFHVRIHHFDPYSEHSMLFLHGCDDPGIEAVD